MLRLLLRLLLGIFSPIVKLLGVSALTDAVDFLRRQLDAIQAKQDEFELRLSAVERRTDAVFHGWELMSKARNMLPHAPAADPSLPGESLADRARRVARHVKAANVEGEGDEPPEDHV